jgi:hypothetical protein
VTVGAAFRVVAHQDRPAQVRFEVVAGLDSRDDRVELTFVLDGLLAPGELR